MKGNFTPGRILGVFLIAVSLLLTTACPKGSALDKAAKADYQLSGLTLDALRAVEKAYQSGAINVATKDRFATKLSLIVAGGKRFNDALNAIDRTQPATAGTLATLNMIFSSEIVAPFLGLLEDLKILSPTQSAAVTATINAIRIALLTISGAFTQAGFASPEMEELNAYA